MLCNTGVFQLLVQARIIGHKTPLTWQLDLSSLNTDPHNKPLRAVYCLVVHSTRLTGWRFQCSVRQAVPSPQSRGVPFQSSSVTGRSTVRAPGSGKRKATKWSTASGNTNKYTSGGPSDSQTLGSKNSGPGSKQTVTWFCTNIIKLWIGFLKLVTNRSYRQ